jgi:hypothetical protein
MSAIGSVFEGLREPPAALSISKAATSGWTSR